MTNKILLRGCAPEPLIHYLKALGIMRLVAEQLDENVRGAWTTNGFELETEKTKDELIEFFLNEYEPTPIITPWNKDGMFLNSKLGRITSDEEEKGKKEPVIGLGERKGREFSFQSIRNSTNQRLSLYRETIYAAERIVEKFVSVSIAKNSPEAKKVLVPLCRNQLDDKVTQWLDAVCLIDGDGSPKTPFLLGGGGNDSRLDFAITFMGQIAEILPLSDEELPNRKVQLQSALFRDTGSRNSEFSTGHFNAGGVGGANATNGIEASYLSNPWNYVLAIEGTLFFSGAASRRLTAGSKSETSYPFWVKSVQHDDLVESNEKNNGELFLPIWERSANFLELLHLFNEGRIRFKKKLSTQTLEQDATNSIEAAQAIASLGIDRGISRFQRFVLVERIGNMKLAASGGFLEVEKNRSPKILELFAEIENWISSFRTLSHGKNPPKEMAVFRRRIDKTIFDYCTTGNDDFLGDLILALGNAERFITKRKSLQEKIKPLVILNFNNWLKILERKKKLSGESGNKDHYEFEIAQSLSSIVGEGEIGLFRSNLEPIEVEEYESKENGKKILRKKIKGWTKNSTSATWNTGSLADNLANVLNRRSIDARANLFSHPQLQSKRFASLDAVAAFLNPEFENGETDDEKIEDYLFALILVDWDYSKQLEYRHEIKELWKVPRIYALLKLLFLPEGKFERKDQKEIIIKHEPSIIPLLRAERINEAVEIAKRRLRSSGVNPLDIDFYYPKKSGARLAASLLIPIDQKAVEKLADLVLPKPEKRID